LPRRRFASLKSKVLWFALVSTLPCLGAIIYILLGRRYTQPALIVDAETLSERGRQ
jgi:hypothetical protein